MNSSSTSSTSSSTSALSNACSASNCKHDVEQTAYEEEPRSSLELECHLDPALSGCCAQDLLSQRRASTLKKILTAHDPSSAAVRTRQSILNVPGLNQPLEVHLRHQFNDLNALSTKWIATAKKESDALDSKSNEEDKDEDGEQEENEKHEDEDTDYDSEEDTFLQKLQDSRKEEMQVFAQQLARAREHGFGMIHYVSLDSESLKLLRPTPARFTSMSTSSSTSHATSLNRLVLLLENNAQMQEQGAVLEYMAKLSQTYLGTKMFVIQMDATPSTSTSEEIAATLAKLRVLPRSLPALLAFHDGDFQDAVTHLKKHESVDDVVDKLSTWLMNTQALQRDLPSTLIECNRVAAKDFQQKDLNEKEDGYDCGWASCRLRYGYVHEHVGASKETKLEMASWRT